MTLPRKKSQGFIQICKSLCLLFDTQFVEYAGKEMETVQYHHQFVIKNISINLTLLESNFDM